MPVSASRTTLLGDEAPGQAVMRRAFADLGLEPFDVPLDPDALAAHPAGAPFGWDVAGKARPPLYASTATTDARTFHLYGDTPAVCFGPLSAGAHGVDERVHVPSIVSTAQAVALFVADWCGVAPAD